MVCWEIFSRERMPYPELASSEDVHRFLSAGQRLPHPAAGCPVELYELVMRRCWDAQPGQRPSFDELAVLLQHLWKQLEDVYEPALTADDAGYEKVRRNGHSGLL